MVVSKENTEEYLWGNNCKGWPLLKTSTLNVIEELMPPGSEEVKHKHTKAQQFFYILKGSASFYLEAGSYTINPFEGIHVEPGTIHKIKNETEDDLEFLVISQPSTQYDRVVME